MKLIIAHLPNDAFDPVRTELNELGVLRVTISEVHSACTETPITLRYRGASLQTRLRPELRLECVTIDGQSARVVDTLRAYAGVKGQVAVVNLEELYEDGQTNSSIPEDARRLSGVS